MERRKHERVDFFQATYCKMMGDSAAAVMHDCWIGNISVGGLSIDIKDTAIPCTTPETMMVLYKIGTRIRNDLVSVRTLRRTLNSWRYGCAFLERDETRATNIENYVSLHH